jgi:hypothetical protein
LRAAFDREGRLVHEAGKARKKDNKNAETKPLTY